MKILAEYTTSKYLFVGIGLSSDSPFTTQAGMAFRSVLASLDLEPNLIEFNKDDFNDETIPENLINEFHDILNNHKNITHVIFMGRTSVSQLANSISKGVTFNSLNEMGFMTSNELNKLKVAVIYHPKYVHTRMQEGDEEAYPQYKNRIEFLLDKNNQKESYNVFINQVSMNEFIQLMPELEKQDLLAIDYETNSEPIFSKYFQISLFSVAINPIGTNDLYSWWIEWKDITQDQINIFHQFIKRVSNKLWAYNCTFEIQVNWRLFGEFIPIQDAMVLMIMNASRSSLKNCVRRFLNADMWESEVYKTIEIYDNLFAFLDSYKRNYANWDDIRGCKSYSDIINVLNEKRIKQSIYDDFVSLTDTFSEDEIYNGVINGYPYGWYACPRSILGPYCSRDSAYTIPLVRMFYDKYKDGYPVYIRHEWLSTLFLANGIIWDDNEAEKQSQYYTNKMKECLYNVLMNLDTIDDSDKLAIEDIMNWTLPYTRIYYTPSGKERSYIVQNETDRLECLKEFFNPNSNTKDSRELFWSVYYTPDIEVASFVYILINELRLRGAWDVYLTDRLSQLKVPDGVTNAETWYIKSLKTDEQKNAANNLLDDLFTYAQNECIGDKSKYSSIITSCITDVDDYYKELTYGRFADEVVCNQYEIQKLFFDINIDDRSTWTKEFDLLFNLRYYKKIYKLLGSNINGVMGRNAVFEIDEDIEPPIRGDHWTENDPNKKYLIQFDFNALGVATHRWSSPFHTVPSGSPVRNILVPRSDSEVWFHMDYSQAELVVLAFFSQDPHMMQVYLNRGDMHKFIASKIFNKPEEDITADERRMSKTVEFSIIYGKSVQNVAVDITGGNVAKAQALFDAFYGAFPGIRTWMNKAVAQAEEYGYVENLFGGRIEIDTEAQDGSAQRTSINYPIQSTSSMIAGAGMYALQEYCKEHNIPQKSYGFTHDSLDSSCHVNDMFKFIDAAVLTMEKRIYEQLGAPMHIDYEIGVNAYKLCEVSDIVKDNTGITFEITGIESDVNDLLNLINTKSQWRIINKELIKTKTITTSWGDMFAAKSAYKDTWGTTQYKNTYLVKIN